MDFSAKATTKDARLLQAPPALFVTAPFLDSTEISKSLWEALFAFHRDGISTAVFAFAKMPGSSNPGHAVPLPASRSSFLAPPTRSF